MAPIRRKPGAVIYSGDELEDSPPSEHEHQSPPTANPIVGNYLPSVNDGLSRHFDELYYLVDIHAHELKECTDRLKIHLQHMEVELQGKLNQVAAGEGSSQDSTTRMQPRITCRNCRTLRATMVCYPCKHLCVCFKCDTEISKCPVCKNIKQSSFMANQSSS